MMTGRTDTAQGAVHMVLATSLGELTVVRDEEGFEEVARQLGEYLAGDRSAFDLLIVARGGEFDRRVWDLISQVPYGQTTTYGDLARLLGPGTDPRDVGAAVGRNPLCII